MKVSMLANGDVQIGDIVVAADDVAALSRINAISAQALQENALQALSRQDSLERLVWPYGPNVDREGW